MKRPLKETQGDGQDRPLSGHPLMLADSLSTLSQLLCHQLQGYKWWPSPLLPSSMPAKTLWASVIKSQTPAKVLSVCNVSRSLAHVIAFHPFVPCLGLSCLP